MGVSKYSEFINNIKSLDYSQYSKVSSREKLVAFAIRYLGTNDIPTSFIYICIATFKLFPDKFYFSEEFREYPHIEMLNRTILHLRPKENNYATGSASTEYHLTPIGEEVAKQVSIDLETKGESGQIAPRKTMDRNKKAIYNDFQKVLDSKEFANFIEVGSLDESLVWSFFGITPYTQIDVTKKFVKQVKEYAEEQGAKEVMKFLSEINKVIS